MQLKVLEGTYRPDRANAGEVFPEAPESLSPPSWLCERAKEKWNELVPILARNGLFTECDTDHLAIYCATWVRWRDAEDHLNAGKITTTARSGYEQVSPYYTIAKTERAELMKLGDKLGLNPSGRSRIHTNPREAEDDLLA